MAIAAVAMVAMTSCEQKKEEPKTDLAVVLKPTTLELTIGEQQKVRASVTPATDNAPAVAFASDNEEVATVDKSGLVTAVAVGTANIIASAEGAKSDTCVVTVLDPLDVFKWGGWTLWNLDKTPLSTDTALVTLRNGMEVHCVLIPGQFHIWDDGIVFSGNSVSGAGNVVIAESPIYLIVDSIDQNGPSYYYLGSSTLTFVDPDEFDMNDTTFAYCAAYNKIVGTAEEHYKWLFGDSTYEGGPAIHGLESTYVLYIDYEAQDADYYFNSLIGPSIFGGEESETDPLYKSNISWFDYGFYGYMGLAMDPENPGYFKEPYEFDHIEERYYEKLDEAPAESPYFIMVPPQHMVGDIAPERYLKPDRLYKK